MGQVASRKSRLGADGDLETERQHLAEKQKLCKARAHKFSLETNRRQRALHERRKQWDMQEQRLREIALQQRRQQVQEATERFQRAHLPPSQRYRPSIRRNPANMEDALSQIQGTLGSYTRQSSLLSSNTNISRSSTSSTVSNPSNRQALSAAESYTKLLQKESRSDMYRATSSQGSRRSESLSSEDSLENEDPNHSTINPQCSHSSFFLRYEKSHSDLRKRDDLCPARGLTSSSVISPDENVAQSSELHEAKAEKQEDSPRTWGFTLFQQTPKTESQPARHDCDLLTLCEITTGESGHLEVKSSQNNPRDGISFINRVVLGAAQVESSHAYQEADLDLMQQRIKDHKLLRYLSATGIPLPSKNWSSKDILYGAPPKPDHSLKDSKTDNLSDDKSVREIGEGNPCLSLQKEPYDSINNLNKISNLECKTENPINAEPLPHRSLSNIQSDHFDSTDEEEQKLPLSVATSRSACEVRFNKGILKKQHKYISADATSVQGLGHFIFAKQVALTIRDSVELTRAKTKYVKVNNPIKKKLRWFDEVCEEKKAKQQNILKQVKDKCSSPSHPKDNSKDHQLRLTADSGSPMAGPSVTPAASTGYQFTREAWTDVGVQVNLPQEQEDEVKVPQSITRSTGPKVPRRESSGKVGPGPVPSTARRRGTVIRAQSAAGVRQIAKTQGKVMEPRPPPRTEFVEEKTPCTTRDTTYGVSRAGVGCKQACVTEKVLHKNHSERFFSPNTYHVINTDSTAISSALPPSCSRPPSSEDNSKSTPVSGRQETESRRRGVVKSEKGLCLACTPTDEEISQLWHGVRSALTTKDAESLLKRQTLQSGPVLRKPCAEQSQQSPGSGTRRPPLSSQPTKKTALVRPRSATTDGAFPNEGLKGSGQLHPAEVHAGGLLEGNHTAAAMDTAQTHTSGTARRPSQQQGLATISFEEKKILLSLDKLNHQLHYLQGHVGADAGTQGSSTREVNVRDDRKRRTSSAQRMQSQKKF
ncbi:centrosomal protein of 126 kDa [Cololabis saira]|uniref:centrosomal protein of 126 kDa n=1 Tax=Cololabis saira TaxID=129043 RepID=UPI002AD4D298|nr:centrosomal protein of 126 kDa [Cololabis saira]